MGPFFALALTYAYSLFPVAYGQSPPQKPPGNSQDIVLIDPLKGQTFDRLVDTLPSGLTKIAIPVVALMFVIGGIMMITAGGKTEQVERARKVLVYAAI